jgi:hypothetical protein
MSSFIAAFLGAFLGGAGMIGSVMLWSALVDNKKVDGPKP